MTVTSKGESHGLANNGKTPLVWVGVIARSSRRPSRTSKKAGEGFFAGFVE
jgi:hypothetical protein